MRVKTVRQVGIKFKKDFKLQSLIDYDALKKKAIKTNANSSCNPNPCLNGGICFEKNHESVCFCPPGYVGSKCDQLFKIKSSICEMISPCKYGKCVDLKENK